MSDSGGALDNAMLLLSQGLDLCVRARKMDAQDRTAAQMAISDAPQEWWDENIEARAARHNAIFPDQPMSTKCGTLALWVQDQYEKDLADWERRARHFLTHVALESQPIQPLVTK
jgi:hypothetical protein